ncbi:ATP-binding protein [Streptomyces naganishii]|uniref:ATP-binding protein n=1 Tax=Streptomyces naganishii TaxID=285447 RepID=UPI0036BCB3F8
MTVTAARAAGTDVPSYSETWPCERASVPKARQLVSTALSLWGMDNSARAADVLLIASELVTNAVVHSGRRYFRLSVSRLGQTTVKVLVADTSRTVPTVKSASSDVESGRGLRLVQVLSVNWGYDRKCWGKAVWAVLEVPSVPARTQES